MRAVERRGEWLGLAVAVGLLTRYVDVLWSLLAGSAFFMSGGLLLLAVAFALERMRRGLVPRQRPPAPPPAPGGKKEENQEELGGGERGDSSGLEAVEEAHRRGCGVIVTVDCGITAHEGVDRARALGIDTPERSAA